MSRLVMMPQIGVAIMVEIFRDGAGKDCILYRPGHSIHWIQARLTWKEPQPHKPGEVVDVGGEIITFATDVGVLILRNHHLPAVRKLVATQGPSATLVGYGVLRFAGGNLVCVKEDDGGALGPCVGRGEVRRPSTVEDLLEDVSDFGGAMIRLQREGNVRPGQ